MTPEEITPHALATFAALEARLPPEIYQRLRSSRAVRRHRDASTVFLFNIWDRHQTDILKREYFSYCLGFDPQHRYSPTTWYLGLEINTIRIYQHSEAIVQGMKEILRKQCPSGFGFNDDGNWVSAVLRFEWNGPLSRFEAKMLPQYEKLIATLHPYIMPIIDSFTYDLTPEEREEVIRSRKKRYFGPAKRLSREEIRQYSRSIPVSWREGILRKTGGKCAECETAVTMKSMHADHIKPFSKGGPTVPDNLQPLCARCNLRKGNRV